MSAPYLWLLVEGEPFLAGVKAWRERYGIASKAFSDMARRLGATGIMVDRYTGRPSSLEGIAPPPGWAKAKGNSSRIRPAKGEAGAAARAELEALPAYPTQGEVARLIGLPDVIRWRDGESWGNQGTAPGYFMFAADLGWAGDDFMIRAIDPMPAIERLRAERPGVAIESGEWTPPAGLTPISEARWRLIEAQAAVAAEERDAQRAA